jgi:CBS domain-containing protein
LLSGLGWLLWRQTHGANLSFFGHWFFQSNLVLALFNLLPAFPLDGGRALRASLSTRMGRVRATRAAVRVSHALAWVLGALGLLGFNLFLVLIAFFIYASAQAEWSMLMSRGLLEGLRAGDVATLVPPVEESQTLAQAIAQMLHSRVTALPVVHSGGGFSIITLQQVRSVPFHFRDTTLVRDLVRRFPGGEASAAEFLEWNTPLHTALSDLAAAPGATLPVSANGKIIGIIRYSDLTEVLQLRSLEKPAA